MIFYIILCDYLPFNDEAEKEITKEVKKGGFDFLEKQWNKEGKGLITKMFTYDPKNGLNTL